MAKVLYDTDVLIDHLEARRALSPQHDGAYSSVTRAELYSFRAVDEAVIDNLLNVMVEIPLDRAVAEEAGRIRRTTRVKLPDAVIAASAIIAKRALVTRNVRDFRKIGRLRVRSGGQ